MYVLRLLLMLVVTGEQYSTSPLHLRRLFRDESDRGDDSVMWNDAYFDRMLDAENSPELSAPLNDDINNEDADLDDEEEDYYNEDEEGEDANVEEDEEESKIGLQTGGRLARYERETLDDENVYDAMSVRGKFARRDVVRAAEDDCDDGATEALQYSDYEFPENEYGMTSNNFRGVASLTEIITAACFLFLIG